MKTRIAFVVASAVLILATAVSATVIDRDVQAPIAEAPAAQATGGEVGAAMLVALQVPAGPRSISAPRPL